MDTKELEYLIAIYEEKSIARAAERLYMAQSSLSQALSTMEVRAGVKFFARTSSGVRVTAAGEMMIEYAYETLDSYRQLKNRMQDAEGEYGGSVLLGISSFRGSYFIPPVLNALRLQYPGIHVRIVEAHSMALEQMISTGNLDLAMLVGPLKNKRVRSEFLMKDEICLITRSDHPVMKYVKPTKPSMDTKIGKYVDLKDTIRYEFVLGETSSILGREARRIFNSAGLRPVSYNSELTALLAASLGAAGQGLAFTYYSSRHYFKDAEFLSLGTAASSVSLEMAMPPGRYHSKAAQIVKDVFFAILG